MVLGVSWSEIKNLKSKIQESSRQRVLVKENWDRIITMIARKLSIDIIAKEIGVSRRTIFRVLSELGLSTKDIIEAYEKMKEAKERKLMLRMEKVKAPPTNWESFKQLPIIQEFIKYCKSRRRASKETVASYLGVIYRVTKDLMVHPSDLTKEHIEKWLDDLITSLGELIREPSVEHLVSGIISALRVFAEFRGFTITHKTTEYTGLWNVYFDVRDRYYLLKIAKETLRKEDFEFITTIMRMYFETTMRAKAITKISNVTIHNDEVTFEVTEKGKKREYTWNKTVHRDTWERFKKYYPLTENIVENRVRTLLTKIYARYFKVPKNVVDEVKKATLLGVRRIVYKKNGKYHEEIQETPTVKEVLAKLKEIVKVREKLVFYALRHQIHIWRHTSAISMLQQCDWNYSIVSVLGGWVKTNVLERVYGKLEYNRARQILMKKYVPKPFAFLYNDYELVDTKEGKALKITEKWLDKAYQEGLISKEYYEYCKSIQDTVIDEIKRRFNIVKIIE